MLIGPGIIQLADKDVKSIFVFFLCCCVGEVMVYFTVHMIKFTLIRWQVAFIYIGEGLDGSYRRWGAIVKVKHNLSFGYG